MVLVVQEVPLVDVSAFVPLSVVMATKVLLPYALAVELKLEVLDVHVDPFGDVA